MSIIMFSCGKVISNFTLKKNLIDHLCFIQLFNNKVKKFQKQYTNFIAVSELSGLKNLHTK